MRRRKKIRENGRAPTSTLCCVLQCTKSLAGVASGPLACHTLSKIGFSSLARLALLNLLLGNNLPTSQKLIFP